MPRPRKTESQSLNKHLPPARCSEEELNAIKSKAKEANISMSAYIRRMAIDGKVVVKKPKGLGGNFELVNQLKKIGTNVNQIAKNLNIFGSPATADQKRVWLKLERVLDDVIATL